MVQTQSKEIYRSETDESGWKACYRDAENYYAKGAYREAFSCYKRASELPNCNPVVFFQLGYLFQHGEGVDSDSIEAFKWYEKAANMGVPQAMYNLAYFYLNGLVVDRDVQKAASLLRGATSLMDRLQLERDAYGEWKATHEAQLAEVQKDAEEKRARSESLELRNRELTLDLSAAKRENRRLEQEVIQHRDSLRKLEMQLELFSARANAAEDALRKEQNARKEIEITASAQHTQFTERLRTSDALITNLAREHGERFERMQSIYTNQIGSLQQAYEINFSELQRERERLRSQNEELSLTLERKMSELSDLQEEIGQVQEKLGRERKKKWITFFIAAAAVALLVAIIFL